MMRGLEQQAHRCNRVGGDVYDAAQSYFRLFVIGVGLAALLISDRTGTAFPALFTLGIFKL
jgi:hypothetical protein